MDKDFSSVGTQYIICECGDNFPNENFLSIHLANGHGEVDTFLCDVCPEAFTSNNLLLQHKLTHKMETKKPYLKTLKTYSGPQAKIPEKMKEEKKEVEKKPPVIKVQTLRKINSISLIQSLKAYGGFIKIEPEPEPPEAPAAEMPEPAPAPVKTEVEAEPEPEAEAEPEPGDTEIYYQCDVCNAIFYTEMDFNVHYQSEHALKQEPQTPTAEQILEQHLVTDHGHSAGVSAAVETVYYYECEICHKIFANEKYFNIHYNKTHGGLLPAEPQYVDTSLPDESLSEELAAQDLVAEETKVKAPEQIVYYKCDLCKILYPSEKAYNTHFDKKHGGNCQVQSTGYHFIEQDLTAEYRPKTKTPAEPKSYPCEFCPKIFNVKRSLQIHRKRVHFDLVKETDGLTEISRAANRSKVCDICGRAYNSNAALRYHQRRHTGEKPYACSVCCKRFTMPMFLQIHMRTHTGEKPYECPHCPKAFTNKAALIRHDRVHTGVKPYPCPECGKFFTQSNSMKLHVSTVHLKLPAPYKSKSRRNKSEARALQLALKGLSTDDQDTLILGE